MSTCNCPKVQQKRSYSFKQIVMYLITRGNKLVDTTPQDANVFATTDRGGGDDHNRGRKNHNSVQSHFHHWFERMVRYSSFSSCIRQNLNRLCLYLYTHCVWTLIHPFPGQHVEHTQELTPPTSRLTARR